MKVCSARKRAQVLQQYREGGGARGRYLPFEAGEDVRAPLLEVENPARHSLRVQAESEHVDRWLQEVARRALQEQVCRVVRSDEFPVSVDDDGRVGVMRL